LGVEVTVISSSAYFFLQNLVEEELLALNNTSVLLAKANATLNDTRNVLITGNSIFEVI